MGFQRKSLKFTPIGHRVVTRPVAFIRVVMLEKPWIIQKMIGRVHPIQR